MSESLHNRDCTCGLCVPFADDQRKRDEEAAEKYALAQQPDFDPSIYSESHEFKAKLRVYFELKWAYYAALKHCHETEVKELKAALGWKEIDRKQYPKSYEIMKHSQGFMEEYATMQREENESLREQLRMAVEKLEIFENRRKLAHSLRGESPHVAAFVESIGVEMDALQKIEAMKGGGDE